MFALWFLQRKRFEIKRPMPSGIPYRAIAPTLPACVDLSERAETALEVGGIEFNWASKHVRRMGREVRLGRMEFYLLGLLISNPGRTFSREHIRRVLWWRPDIDPRTVDVVVGRLRRAINRRGLPDPIGTVVGYGYRFSENFEQEFSQWLARRRKKLRLKGTGVEQRKPSRDAGHDGR
jgi:DNA-binding response OmpR family regulator